jgi:MFS transporter, SP family, solute carrier family 2 (facilitated glucose transporter), member 3
MLEIHLMFIQFLSQLFFQVFYYSVSIFEKIGLSSADAKWANLGAGCMNLFVSFFSPLLMARVNRRPLSILSCVVCGVFLFALTLFFRFIVSEDILSEFFF